MEAHDRVRAYIEKHDRLVELLGVKIEEVAPGYAKVSLTVEEKHMNAAGVCQGGVIFTLADLAFALASNSHGKMALGLDVSISYLRAVPLGERLVAEAFERHLGGRTGLYTLIVKDSQGREVAFAKAMAYRFDKPFPP